MKVVVLFESMTGNTRRAAELIGGAVQSRGHDVAVHPVTAFDYHELADADLVFLGSWTDGLVLFGQRPGRAARLRKLPVLDHKPVALFVTYAINAGRVLDRFTALAEARGARVIAAHQFKRTKIAAGIDPFVDAALAVLAGDAVVGPPPSAQVEQPRSTA